MMKSIAQNMAVVLIYLGGIALFIGFSAAMCGGFDSPNESAPFEIHSVEYLSDADAFHMDRATVITATTGATYVLEGWVDVPAKGTICVVVYAPGLKRLKIVQ